MTRDTETDVRVQVSATKAEAIGKIMEHINARKFQRLFVVGILDETDAQHVPGENGGTVLVASSENHIGSALLMMKALEGLTASREAGLAEMLEKAMEAARADAKEQAEASEKADEKAEPGA